MEKKETNTLSIFQRPVWVSLFALTAAISWGWAYPLIKMGMEEYQITADMTGSKMLFAGIRFFISGIIILAIDIQASSFSRSCFSDKCKMIDFDIFLNTIVFLSVIYSRSIISIKAVSKG